MTQKICKTCGNSKDLSEFRLQKARQNAVPHCKQCESDNSKARYWKTKELQNKQDKLNFLRTKVMRGITVRQAATEVGLPYMECVEYVKNNQILFPTKKRQLCSFCKKASIDPAKHDYCWFCRIVQGR